MGKLMILKLRQDYKAKLGDKYSLKDFHDTFIKLGPLPLPLIRKAMLGEVGNPFQGNEIRAGSRRGYGLELMVERGTGCGPMSCCSSANPMHAPLS